jgi:hypothetical protein
MMVCFLAEKAFEGAVALSLVSCVSSRCIRNRDPFRRDCLRICNI